MQIKPTPYNPQFEQIVIGCLLIEPSLSSKIIKLSSDIFYTKPARSVFEMIKKEIESGNSFDTILLIEKAKDDETKLFLMKAIQEVQTVSTFDYYITQLQDLALRRELLRIGMSLQETDNADVFDIINEIKLKLDNLKTNRIEKTKYEKLKEILSEYEALKERGCEMEMNIPTIDDYTNGLRRKRLYILGGQPGIGKTNIALNIARQIATKKKVLFFSLEMSYFDIIGRLMSMIAEIPSWKIQKPWFLTKENLVRMELCAKRIHDELNLVIIDSVNSVADMVVKIKDEKPDLVIVDHLQYLTFSELKDKKNIKSHEVINNNIKVLRDLAIRNDFCLFMLSQVRRPETVKKQIPHLTDFQGSSGIEQQADVGMILDCPKSENPHILELYIVKNRNGLTGKTKIAFHSETLQYSELYDDDANFENFENENIGGEEDDRF